MKSIRDDSEEYEDYDNDLFETDTSFLDDVDLTKYKNPVLIATILVEIENFKNIIKSFEYLLLQNGQSYDNTKLEEIYTEFSQIQNDIIEYPSLTLDEINLIQVINDVKEYLNATQINYDAESEESLLLEEGKTILDEIKTEAENGNIYYFCLNIKK
jgi:hypothetical protein